MTITDVKTYTYYAYTYDVTSNKARMHTLHIHCTYICKNTQSSMRLYVEVDLRSGLIFVFARFSDREL